MRLDLELAMDGPGLRSGILMVSVVLQLLLVLPAAVRARGKAGEGAERGEQGGREQGGREQGEREQGGREQGESVQGVRRGGGT